MTNKTPIPLPLADRALLGSIPAVGRRTATAVRAELLPDERLPSAESAGYCGLAPREFHSGPSARRRTRLSKAGNARLRKALFLPTQAAVRFNPLLARLFDRLVEAGKPRTPAVGACMRKLVMLCYGVLKTRAPFDPNRSPRIAPRQHATWFGPIPGNYLCTRWQLAHIDRSLRATTLPSSLSFRSAASASSVARAMYTLVSFSHDSADPLGGELSERSLPARTNSRLLTPTSSQSGSSLPISLWTSRMYAVRHWCASRMISLMVGTSGFFGSWDRPKLASKARTSVRHVTRSAEAGKRAIVSSVERSSSPARWLRELELWKNLPAVAVGRIAGFGGLAQREAETHDPHDLLEPQRPVCGLTAPVGEFRIAAHLPESRRPGPPLGEPDEFTPTRPTGWMPAGVGRLLDLPRLGSNTLGSESFAHQRR